MQAFLGFGLLRPFRRDQKADFAAAGGEQLIRSAVGQILGTVGSSDFTQGEVPWRTDVGSLLHALRHQKNEHILQELARVYVIDALKRWEPRIAVISVRAKREQQDDRNVLAISLQYEVPTPNIRAGDALLLAEQTVRL
jgi:phage baseplate assembly protein W